jgi:hypothetical protein
MLIQFESEISGYADSWDWNNDIIQAATKENIRMPFNTRLLSILFSSQV